MSTEESCRGSRAPESDLGGLSLRVHSSFMYSSKRVDGPGAHPHMSRCHRWWGDLCSEHSTEGEFLTC